MTDPARFIAPGASLDFELDWADPADPWLQTGESIATFDPSVEGGLTIDSHSLTGSVTRVWVSCPDDQTPGSKVFIRFKVITNSTPPRDDSRYWELSVVRRSPGN
jgi:hypothetical protein